MDGGYKDCNSLVRPTERKLALSMLGKLAADAILKYFSNKIAFDISCKFAPYHQFVVARISLKDYSEIGSFWLVTGSRMAYGCLNQAVISAAMFLLLYLLLYFILLVSHYFKKTI